IYFGAAARKKGALSVIRAECMDSELTIEKLGAQLFARCQNNFGGTHPRSYVDVAASNGEGRTISFDLYCSCFGFDIRGLRFVNDSTIQFELLSNAVSIELDSLEITLEGEDAKSDRA